MFVDRREGAGMMWGMGNVRGTGYNNVAWLRKIFEGEQTQVPRNIWERKEIAGISLRQFQVGLTIHFCYALVAVMAGILFKNLLFLEDCIQRINKTSLSSTTYHHNPPPCPAKLACRTRPIFSSSGKTMLFGVIQKKKKRQTNKQHKN